MEGVLLSRKFLSRLDIWCLRDCLPHHCKRWQFGQVREGDGNEDGAHGAKQSDMVAPKCPRRIVASNPVPSSQDIRSPVIQPLVATQHTTSTAGKAVRGSSSRANRIETAFTAVLQGQKVSKEVQPEAEDETEERREEEEFARLQREIEERELKEAKRDEMRKMKQDQERRLIKEEEVKWRQMEADDQAARRREEEERLIDVALEKRRRKEEEEMWEKEEEEERRRTAQAEEERRRKVAERTEREVEEKRKQEEEERAMKEEWLRERAALLEALRLEKEREQQQIHKLAAKEIAAALKELQENETQPRGRQLGHAATVEEADGPNQGKDAQMSAKNLLRSTPEDASGGNALSSQKDQGWQDYLATSLVSSILPSYGGGASRRPTEAAGGGTLPKTENIGIGADGKVY